MEQFLNDEESGARSDHREERRWNIPIPVRVKGTRGGDGTEFEEETITADASPSGMCILLTVRLEMGEQILVVAPEEEFESPAVVVQVSSLGTGMNRARVQFPTGRKFGRAAAKKKYIYDYAAENWAGYICDGIYYNSKHEPFGKLEENLILSMSTGEILFRLARGRMFDQRGNCLGHII
jgi:hypothetical protein